MQDSIYIIFLVFGCIWILMGAVGWIAFLRSEGQEMRFSKWGVLVTFSIIVPIIAALSYGALHH